jgi:hypothetical protein
VYTRITNAKTSVISGKFWDEDFIVRYLVGTVCNGFQELILGYWLDTEKTMRQTSYYQPKTVQKKYQDFSLSLDIQFCSGVVCSGNILRTTFLQLLLDLQVY